MSATKKKKENNHPTNASSYGVSEEMADAVFEKILPYITSSDDKELLNRQIEKPNLEIYMYLEAQKKLVELQERFEKLERITEEQKEFLSSIKVILSQQSSKLSDALNIDLAIQKANVCLDNCSKYSFPYHESSAKVVFDNFLLSNTPNEENGFFPQESNIPCMQEDIKALKLEFWNRLNEKIDTNEGVHIRRKDTLPLCNVNGLHIDIPDGNETDKLINIDGQDIFEGKADTEEGMENANINTDTFSEPIKLGSDINTALEHHNGCIEASLICTRVSDVLSKKLSSNSSGNLKMIQNENVNYTEENLSSISKDSLNPKESKSSVSGNIGMENSNHLKYCEDEERNHSYSQKEFNEKLYFKVESEKSGISEDISKNFSSSEVESSN
ncbi:hypothetical protein Avbf_02441 [Armadillidium vulgare]|nr:hypothetical protein Avbf_02441 [Armadillidium vulgare]